MYDYKQTLKSNLSDELINTYLLRPIAGFIVWILYPTSVTPNQVTIASTIVGLVAAWLYVHNEAGSTAIAGLLVTLKDVFDSADGQLARAKQQYSRIGRFLDSIGDFVVNLAVFGTIGWVLFTSTGNVWMIILAVLGLAGITLRVSYHVYYLSSYLHLEDKYQVNRITEEITSEDRTADALTVTLQRIFQVIYGWQDRLMLRIDRWCSGGDQGPDFAVRWYSDVPALRLSGLIGIGTELFLLMLCSVFNALQLYLLLNVFLMNSIMFVSIFYRRLYLRPTILLKG
ncbi:MAG: CDP-alcohol phosphatidyltransferase family protein [Ignavibacteriales bacterium]|nr:CDP-alcohol phosphatidyltransferase family protein [Ignavibacteriales bacterium]